MTMNTQGRPTQPGSATASASATFSGDRGLEHDEPLLFEIGRLDNTGVDLPEPKKVRTITVEIRTDTAPMDMFAMAVLSFISTPFR